jgi:hypothetical protein
MLQAAGTDAVRSFFIFLHLLECQAELVAERLLAHSQYHAAHANALSDMFVGWMYSVLWRHATVLARESLAARARLL